MDQDPMFQAGRPLHGPRLPQGLLPNPSKLPHQGEAYLVPLDQNVLPLPSPQLQLILHDPAGVSPLPPESLP